MIIVPRQKSDAKSESAGVLALQGIPAALANGGDGNAGKFMNVKFRYSKTTSTGLIIISYQPGI